MEISPMISSTHSEETRSFSAYCRATSRVTRPVSNNRQAASPIWSSMERRSSFTSSLRIGLNFREERAVYPPRHTNAEDAEHQPTVPIRSHRVKRTRKKRSRMGSVAAGVAVAPPLGPAEGLNLAVEEKPLQLRSAPRLTVLQVDMRRGKRWKNVPRAL